MVKKASPKKKPRPEQVILDELGALCVEPGYVHALAYLCFRDNMVPYIDEVTASDLAKLDSMECLSRTEIATVIGLMVKAPIDNVLPKPETTQRHIDRTDQLLAELHDAMSVGSFDLERWQDAAKSDENPFATGAAMREPIFYGGESAYNFQYRDFSPRKYAADDGWLKANKGFTISEAGQVIAAAGDQLEFNWQASLDQQLLGPLEELTYLPSHVFTVEQVATRTGFDPSLVEQVLKAFVMPDPPTNAAFAALHDFNEANATPLIKRPDGYLCFQHYSLWEALYEAPFYWMGADKGYSATAMTHRGRFTEEVTRERLELVFGKKHVHPNVDILESKGKKLGEIDVLVVFGDRLIVLQAKSKRLTLAARKGNDLQIKDDFKKSVQDSYDQGFLCASAVGDARYRFVDAAGAEIVLPSKITEIYILCVVSDHYPALSFQARQFLTERKTAVIRAPFVLDIFTLDAITEMLQSPLRFLSYLNRRTEYADRLLSAQELTILSYHLQKNLWLDDEHSMVMLGDGIAADLDLAMSVRRNGVPGAATPDGILTRLAGTPIGQIINDIENAASAEMIELGFMLLTLSEDTFKETNQGIQELARRARIDGRCHDLTVGLGIGGVGFTVHCTDAPPAESSKQLFAHCAGRKYTERASRWFGVCMRPRDLRMLYSVGLNFPWVQDAAMDAATAGLAKPVPIAQAVEALHKKVKIGRNEPCPCGSGQKHKRCCLRA